MIKSSPRVRGYSFFGISDGDEREYENIIVQSIDTKGIKNYMTYGDHTMALPPRSPQDFFNHTPSLHERRGYEFTISGTAFIDRQKLEFFNDEVPF